MATLPPDDAVSRFTERVFEPLARADQRAWARRYLRALLTTPGKKSVRRLAASVSASPTAAQALHQFVNVSPWDWTPVREELVRWTERRLAPQAWVVDLAVLPKRGEHSCGVHRRFVAAAGRPVTCQVGVGAFLTTAAEAVPVDWRLQLPGAWGKEPHRRRRARIPCDVGFRPPEQHALELVDSLAGASRTAPVPVVAHLGATPRAGSLARGLAARNRDFVLAVPDGLRVRTARSPGHLPHPRGEEYGPVRTARGVLDQGLGPLRTEETVRPGGREHRAAVATALVHPVDRPSAGPPHRAYRLFTVRPEESRPPSQLWLTNMTHVRTENLLALTRLPARTRQTTRRLEDDLGLLDFEGRSYPGWHHHMTLVSAAYALHHLHHRPCATARV
ncbi:transposase [Streptomyces globisporus]|uniref:IS701 family transposase n=1 Tax=Streptomyces globisporus TaxID=1908 RepID=UPI0005694FB8|nr:transposase [Streptomyces globisporus]